MSRTPDAIRSFGCQLSVASILLMYAILCAFLLLPRLKFFNSRRLALSSIVSIHNLSAISVATECSVGLALRLSITVLTPHAATCCAGKYVSGVRLAKFLPAAPFSIFLRIARKCRTISLHPCADRASPHLERDSILFFFCRLPRTLTLSQPRVSISLSRLSWSISVRVFSLPKSHTPYQSYRPSRTA